MNLNLFLSRISNLDFFCLFAIEKKEKRNFSHACSSSKRKICMFQHANSSFVVNSRLIPWIKTLKKNCCVNIVLSVIWPKDFAIWMIRSFLLEIWSRLTSLTCLSLHFSCYPLNKYLATDKSTRYQLLKYVYTLLIHDHRHGKGRNGTGRLVKLLTQR